MDANAVQYHDYNPPIESVDNLVAAWTKLCKFLPDFKFEAIDMVREGNKSVSFLKDLGFA